MKQVGVVLETNKTHAKLLVTRMAACGSSCESCSSHCGENKPEYLDIINDKDLQVGDKVELLTDSKLVLKYIGLVYGLPLVFLIVGVICGIAFHLREIYSMLLGMFFMLISFIVIKRIDSKYNGMGRGFIVRKI